MKKRNALKILSLAILIFMLSFSLFACGKKDKTKVDETSDTDESLDTNGKFEKGLKVLGIDIGGMNANEATLELANSVQSYSNSQNITVNIPGQTAMDLPAYSLGVSIDLTKTLNNALVLSNDGFVKTQIESLGFYEAPILHDVDEAKLRAALDEQASAFTTEPVEPSVNFTPESGDDKFTFSDGSPGTTVDVEALYSAIVTAANGGSSPIVVTANVTQVAPTQNITDLQQNISKIVSFSTNYTGSADRTHNLVLGAAKLNNITLKPGEAFSFNDRVGPRDEKGGWKEAATIVDGSRYENDYGGGICQISTTLYNAVLKADLKIVTRNKHSIPSNYIEHGLDATVSYGGYDFVFQNNTDYPVYIFSHIDKSAQKVFVTIYGRPLPDGEKIILRSKELSSVGPGEPEIMQDETLAAGKTEWQVPARKGFTVQSYKEYVKDGVVLRTENLTTDKYQPVSGVKRVGVGAGGSSGAAVQIPNVDFENFGSEGEPSTSEPTDIPPETDLPPVTDDDNPIDLPVLGDDDDGEIPFE